MNNEPTGEQLKPQPPELASKALETMQNVSRTENSEIMKVKRQLDECIEQLRSGTVVETDEKLPDGVVGLMGDYAIVDRAVAETELPKLRAANVELQKRNLSNMEKWQRREAELLQSLQQLTDQNDRLKRDKAIECQLLMEERDELLQKVKRLKVLTSSQREALYYAAPILNRCGWTKDTVEGMHLMNLWAKAGVEWKAFLNAEDRANALHRHASEEERK